MRGMQLSTEATNIIKYCILVEVRLSYILNNFVLRCGNPIIPDVYCGLVDINYVNRTSVKNIRTSLQSFRQRRRGKSQYSPLPRGFNPYSYIRPGTPGSEIWHILPPFTEQHWESQFAIPQPHNIMSASHRNHHSSSSNHRSASGYTEENKTEPPFTNVSKDLELDRIPPSIKPNIKGYQKMFQDVFVDYHLLASLDGDNHAFIGEDFNIFIAHIPNGITRDGCKEGALLIGNIQFIPYYNNLPIEAAAFVCDDRRTIVIPHLHGINPESFDCIYKWYQNQTDHVGNELQQIEAATKALRAAHASHPPHYYGMNAIEIDNLPRRLSLSGDIQVLRSDNAPSRLLVPDIITKTFEHLCKFYNKKYPYHHTIFGYLCTYEGKGTKVRNVRVWSI